MCLVDKRILSELLRTGFQVSHIKKLAGATGIGPAPVQRQKRIVLATTWQDLELRQVMDAQVGKWEERSEAKGGGSRHPWKHRKAGENQAEVGSGKADRVKDAARRLWGSIARHDRTRQESVQEGLSGLEVIAMKHLTRAHQAAWYHEGAKKPALGSRAHNRKQGTRESQEKERKEQQQHCRKN